MFHVILFQPEIPPNTGNVIRLCANSGCHLHLIEPLGFDMDDKRLRRAGLDYHEYATLKRHADLASCLESLGHPRLFAFTTKGSRPFHDASFAEGDAFLFGPRAGACRPKCSTPCPTAIACACRCAKAVAA
ncbi:tRNA (cytidine(34)-2'-O)-methyltransferase [Pseudomonas sp. R2-37-08W]|nr:tRNA (cytidine(34)-2'-O)-methyltransferase [Pseudomonas sp. R2-37-08W]